MAKDLVRKVLSFDASSDAGKEDVQQILLTEDYTFGRLSFSSLDSDVKIQITEGETVPFFDEYIETAHFAAGADGAYTYGNPRTFRKDQVYYLRGKFSGTGTKAVSVVFHPPVMR